jgi:hypothetical protein
LPSATADAAGRYRSYSVAHYLADFGVWQHWFVPGLRQAFGLAWPVILGLAAAGLVLALVRGDLLVRVLGIVGVVSFVGYVFTPASAGGASGRPVLFASDTRFALPALVLGMLLLPRLVPRTSSVGRLWLPALLGIALLNDLGYAFSASIGFATLAGFVEVISVGVIVVLLIVWSTRPARTLAAVGCGLLVVGIAGGWLVERAYVRNRYTNVAQHIPYGSAPRDELAAIYAWVDGVSGARIALNGLGISYPLFGRDLSNHVQYVGHRGSHGAFTEVRSCNEWRRLLNNGHYDYVVISPDARDRSQPRTVAWTRSDPAAVPVVEAGKAVVFRVDGSLDPSTCPAN